MVTNLNPVTDRRRRPLSELELEQGGRGPGSNRSGTGRKAAIPSAYRSPEP